MLLFGRFSDGKVLLHELLLQDIPLGDSFVMMIQHAKPVLDLNQLLLRESLDIARLEHLDTFVSLVEDDARVATEAGAVAHFGMNLLLGEEGHLKFALILRIQTLGLARLAVSAFEVRYSIRGQVYLVTVGDQLEE
jgi:hypothetical protein